MTRKEEIQNYAYNNCISDDIDDTSYSLIVETAEWADTTMIDKACEWLESAIKPYMGYGATSDFVDTFRKAMEE